MQFLVDRNPTRFESPTEQRLTDKFDLQKIINELLIFNFS
ncbi:hypothetical protein VC0101557_14030 [Vibrio cholerae VC0101557]|uniref:Uncharacterized protein n=1 Tax=Vibrio cholerae (strain MO10) TaxID=345072 RepID=A0A0X1L059_VIBCO|nr:hypothetical protein ASZ80_03517 [Vibrio cholerae]EAZ72278.1 hypothetical protein A5C_A0810 [Vibrio cholerae NCTC 8457]EET23905.1 conserved hypothetical protein [Vibrio cholerae MO10]EGR01238.1 hypothetical protein VCHCUF01_2365 [Vibrio cholerae HCUF01]EGR05349.1 hypothetical protein VCHC49A2_0557 [Vibrio cholerae HC-49A2]EGS53327.1 hypothetical protein VCHC70A1_3334 [Vibrio cholerae HC-70A1]EGS55008.1 hypothetical protein VCHC48A1_3314 [Vibrio cholerae HC-48A1]EGS55039.1 hypothetical pro